MSIHDSNILVVTKEKILETSKKCPQAKEVLQTLFPEVFKNNHPAKVMEGQVYILKNRGMAQAKCISNVCDYYIVTRCRYEGELVGLQLTNVVSGNFWAGVMAEGVDVKGHSFWGSCGPEGWEFVGFGEKVIRIIK